jgi:hypothetical protein
MNSRYAAKEPARDPCRLVQRVPVHPALGPDDDDPQQDLQQGCDNCDPQRHPPQEARFLCQGRVAWRFQYEFPGNVKHRRTRPRAGRHGDRRPAFAGPGRGPASVLWKVSGLPDHFREFSRNRHRLDLPRGSVASRICTDAERRPCEKGGGVMVCMDRIFHDTAILSPHRARTRGVRPPTQALVLEWSLHPRGRGKILSAIHKRPHSKVLRPATILPARGKILRISSPPSAWPPSRSDTTSPANLAAMPFRAWFKRGSPRVTLCRGATAASRTAAKSYATVAPIECYPGLTHAPFRQAGSRPGPAERVTPWRNGPRR